MQYKVSDGHGLPHDPFKSLVAPRPIGWISTVDKQGRYSLAPYSFFNIVSADPHMVMFCSERKKDSVLNIEETGEFVCSLASYPQREAMVACSAALAHGESEFEYAGLEMASSSVVAPPRVKGSPAALECRYVRTIDMDSLDTAASHFMVIGQVVAIYIDDKVIREGQVDTKQLQYMARGGYFDYFVADQPFPMNRPS